MIELIERLFSAECYFRTHFRMYCPGCGGSRAATALLNGNLIQSLKYNPITILFLLDVLIMTGLDIIGVISHRKIKFTRFELLYNISLLAFIVVYFVLRNYLLIVHGIDLLGDFT